MTAYMPPITRRKKVEERYNPDTFRVFGQEAETSHPKYESQSYRASFEPPTPDESLFPEIARCRRTRVLPKALPDYRANRPFPKSCSFINTDVRLLNEPICTVHTKATDAEQHAWWPSRPNPGKLEKGEHTLDTIYRNDFLHTKELAPQPSYRHSANPNKEPARGIAPVNFLREKDGSQGFYKEGMSYEHMYDSRKDPNYPIRAKRQGSFVYSKMDPQAKQRFIDYHNKLNMEENQQAADKIKLSRSAKRGKPEEPTEVGQNNPLPSPTRSPKSAPVEIPSPKMMPTRSSPVEFYDPTGRIPQ